MAAVQWEAIAGTSLRDFGTGSRIVEFAVPWCEQTLFLVPQAFHIAGLQARGVTRGRIWVMAEVLDLLKRNVNPQDELAIAQTKLLVDGTVTGTTDGVAAAPSATIHSSHVPAQRALPFGKAPRRRAA